MTKTQKRQRKTARPGSRFPSEVLGENVRAIRSLRGLSQRELLEHMEGLGFDWAQATLSELERGLRPTGVDELFALAVALETTVVRLLDPSPEPSPGGAIDLTSAGLPLPSEMARGYLVNETNPWALEPAEGIIRVSWHGNVPLLWAHGKDPQKLIDTMLEAVRQQDLKALRALSPDEKERLRQALEAAPEEGGPTP